LPRLLRASASIAPAIKNATEHTKASNFMKHPTV
jgi:hypothetical protein